MPFRLNQIEKKRAYEEIVEVIWTAIERYKLQPGDRLPSEMELSRQLSVARPTLREALSVLHYLGVIDSVQGGGYYVKALTRPDLTADLAAFSRTVSPYDVVTARLALEPEAARLAAENRTDEDLARMKAALDKTPEPPPRGAYPLPVDNEFHIALAGAAGNPLILSMVRNLIALRDQTPLYQAVLKAGFGKERYLSDVRQDHLLVYQAVEAADPEAAHRAMRRHHLNVKEHVFGE